MIETAESLLRWAQALDPGFAFMLALPFVVAAAGLVAEGARRMRRGPPPGTGGT